MKRSIVCILLLFTLWPCRTDAVDLSATSGVLIEAETGEILWEKDPDRQMRIASTTKIMTALVVLERCDLQKTVTVTAAHMAEGSSMYLVPGEAVTVEELLYGLLLCSGNDAALALAEYCGGSVARFAELMNEKALDLGMSGTSFANPSGLDAEGHCSTARDMALLAAYAAENPVFMRICSTSRAVIGQRDMRNHNRLLNSLPGCVGMKTGYTRAAGRTLVSCVQRDGHRLVAVTLQDGNDWADHETLYTMGFELLNEMRETT